LLLWIPNLAQLPVNHTPKLAVPTRQQVCVRAVLDDFAAVQQDHAVGLRDRRKTMGDENDGDFRIGKEIVQRRVNLVCQL
jgi:hypothetical protein